MKKIVTASLVIFLFAGYAVYERSTQVPSSSVASASTPVQTPANAKPAQTVAVADAPKGKYKDGTYTGDSVDAYYGNVQVQVTVSGGRIKDVSFLSYPNDRGDSIQINTYAMPRLSRQAIAAQSASVSGVSGATDTSDAFRRSLSSALSQAA